MIKKWHYENVGGIHLNRKFPTQKAEDANEALTS